MEIRDLLNLSSRDVVTRIKSLDACYTDYAELPVSYVEGGWEHNLNMIISVAPTREQIRALCNISKESSGYLPISPVHGWKPEDMPMVTSPDTGSLTLPTFLLVSSVDSTCFGLYMLDYADGQYFMPVHSSRLKARLFQEKDPEFILLGISSVCQIFCNSLEKWELSFGVKPPAFVISGHLSSDSIRSSRKTAHGMIEFDFHEFTIEGLKFSSRKCYSILPGTREHIFLNQLSGADGKI